MRNVRIICLPSTRSSSEISITASSHAYSISRFEAIVRKFCSDVKRMISSSMASVTVLDASMMQVRLARKLCRLKFLSRRDSRVSVAFCPALSASKRCIIHVIRNLMPRKFTTKATMP